MRKQAIVRTMQGDMKVNARRVVLSALPERVFLLHENPTQDTGISKSWTVTDAISGVAIVNQWLANERQRDIIERANEAIKTRIPAGQTFDGVVKQYMKQHNLRPLRSNIKNFA